MSLRQQVATDIAAILSDDETGFGWSITLTDPTGLSAMLTGFSNDVAQTIDPDTGQAVVGREASVALEIAALTEAGLGLPKAIHEEGRFPWRVSFADINGNPHTFKVRESMPDRAAGIVVCLLETYKG